MSSGEVQPRRRRDKKKKKAQLEALAKVEWEEGTALYGADEGHDDEGIVEPSRDSSSSGEEEDVCSESGSTQSMTYKIIFFILLLLLGGVATLILVENNIPSAPGENENKGGGLESFTEAAPIIEDSIQSSILSDTNEVEGLPDPEEKKDDVKNWIEEFNILESISGFLSNLIEVSVGIGFDHDTTHQSQTEDEEETLESMTPKETANDLGEIEEEFDEITEEVLENIERQEVSELLEEPMTQIPTPEHETQIEHPVTECEIEIEHLVTEPETQIKNPLSQEWLPGDRQSASSEQQQWQSSYSLENKEPIRSLDNSKESFNYINPETLELDDKGSLFQNPEIISEVNPSPSESQKDELDSDLHENPKSNGNILEDLFLDDDGIML